MKNLKKIGVNTTVLATSLALAACGGGGYYDNDSSSNSNTDNSEIPSDIDVSEVPDSLKLTLQDFEGKVLQIAQDNSSVQVAVKVLNKDKGGIAGQDIRLAVTDTDNIGVDSNSAKITTADDGVAIFTVNIPTLQKETGKVILTAVVDGTTISTPYTLNIKKTSTIVSDYTLKAAQGTVLNLPKGTADIAVQVTDENGGAKAGQTVELTLPEEMQGKFVTTSGSSISTDEQGKAVFSIQANADLTTAEIAEFVDSSQVLNFKLIDEHRAERLETASLTFKDVSKIVETLEVVTPETSISAKAGVGIVRVFAKNTNGDVLVNTNVKLAVDAVAASYGVTLDKTEATTNANGYAEFKVQSEATHPLALAQRGIALTATYSANNQNIKGNATLQVVTAEETVDDQEKIQRLEIASPFKVNAQNDQVAIKVKAINFKGVGATEGKISIELNPDALSNGVTFDGASQKEVDENGFVEFILKTNAKDAAIERLVDAGIIATFTADSGATNKIEIGVENEEVSDETISYLQIDPIVETFDAKKDQTINIKVKAIGVKGSPLRNQKIVLKQNKQFSALGLSLVTQAELLTDAQGYVTYTLDYKYDPNSTTQQDAAKAGILLALASVSDPSKTQSVKVNFKSVEDKIELDYFTVETVGSKEIQLNSNTPITVNTVMMGVDGKALAGQEVTLKIDEALLSNGVSYSGKTTVTSDANGKAKFNLNVNATNRTQLSALIASGLSLTISSKRMDGTAFTVTRKVELVAATGGAIASQVDYLLIDPILSSFDPTKDQTISVKVKAVAQDGSPLKDEKITIKPELTNEILAKLHLSLVGAATQQTDDLGYATFVYSYKFAKTVEQNKLPTTEVRLVATSANAKTQSLNLNFKVPTVDTILDLDNFSVETDGKVTLDKNNTAQTEIKVHAIGTDGKDLSGQKINIHVDATENNGVSVDALAKTTVDGKTKFTLNIDTQNAEELQALLTDGLTVTVTSSHKDGSVYSVVRKIAVVEPAPVSQVSYLAVDPINTVFDYTVNQTMNVKVKALKADGSIAASEKVNISTLTSDMAQKLGLTLTSSAEQVTDATGYATFTFAYKFANTPEQIKLPIDGVELTVSSNGKSQPVKLNFKAPTVQQTLDYFTLTSNLYAVTLDGSAKTISITVNAKDEKGAALSGQSLSIGLNDAAAPNGVTLTSPTTTVTENGKATFTLKIDPKTDAAIENLDVNDLTVAVVGKRPDGSQYSAVQRIELSKPKVVLQDLANFEITPVDPTLSVLGGETRVKLVARDADGKAIPNTPIAVALSSLTSARVSLSDVPATTNSKGEAEFTVTVAEGEYDASLIKNGIIFAVVGSNLNNGDRLQQTGSIGITAPANALNPRLRADVDAVTAGQTIKVYASVKDEMGINAAAGTPMRLTLDQDAVAAGVRFSGNVDTISVVTQDGSDVPVDLIVPEGISTATLAQIQITGTIKDPRGVEIKTPALTLTVEDIVNPNHLDFGAVSNNSMDVNGDSSIITVQLLDQNNQPVANQDVTLSANNSASLIIATPGESHQTNTSGEPQTVQTDSNGNAFFSVEIADNLTQVQKDLLLASQIELTASNMSENGAETSQIYRIATFESVVPTPIVQPARYSLRIEAKPTMNVRDDTADVVVMLVDENGGGVADRYVTLGLDDFSRNGAIILGGSGLTTDENGQAIFKIKIDENARRNYSAAEFVNDDLRLTAHFSETGYADATQISLIDIVQAAVQTPVASIVIGVNPTQVASSSDGVYYTKNMSVSVVDFDGKPLANQVVVLDSTPLTYIKGRNLWALAPTVGSDPAEQWVFGNQSYYDLTNPNVYLDASGQPMNNNATPADLTDDYIAATTTNNIHACMADPAGTAVGTNNTPVKVVTFVSQSGAEQNTFTTDENGKFDFAMRYPKIYAQWLTVQVGASATVASLPNRTTYSLGLAPSANDYASDGTYSPNEVSPYGTVFTCP